MEFNEQNSEAEKLKSIIYKLVRGKEISEQERDMVEKIVEEKDYPQDF